MNPPPPIPPPQPRKSTALFYQVGNTYQKGSKEWNVYVDVVSGNSNLISKVKFEVPTNDGTMHINNNGGSSGSTKLVSYPVTVQQVPGGTTNPAKRFAIKVQDKSIKKNSNNNKHQKQINIKIVGSGGTGKKMKYKLQKTSKYKPVEIRSQPKLFLENRKVRPNIRYKKLPTNITFGIELELSCIQNTPRTIIAENITQKANVPTKVIIGYDKSLYHGWKLEDDSSIICSRSNPNCSRFELVSPILCGGVGAQECYRVIQAVTDIRSSTKIDVNQSMGFHVHVGVQHLKFGSIKNICLNFIKFEDVIDSFMPQSRRSQSGGNIFCQSNKAAIQIIPTTTTTTQEQQKQQQGNNSNNTFASIAAAKHQAIMNCKTIEELCNLVNPGVGGEGLGGRNRYYKLNLQNLKTGRQPTIEFRQHSGTCNYDKIIAWIRFCIAFVNESSKQSRPGSLKPSSTMSFNDQFELLFETIIQDRALRDYYANRRVTLQQQHQQTDTMPCQCHNHPTTTTTTTTNVGTSPFCQCCK